MSLFTRRHFIYFRLNHYSRSMAIGLVGISSQYYQQRPFITVKPDSVIHPMKDRSRSDFLTVQQSESELIKYAKSYAIQHPQLDWISINKCASNDPIEDNHKIYKNGNDLIFSVFDGHAGYECASVASQVLGSYIRNATLNTENIPNALKHAYLELDGDITNAPIDLYNELPKNAHPNDSTPIVKQFMQAATVALSGACSISAYFTDNQVHVANIGDARAIIGQSSGQSTGQSSETSDTEKWQFKEMSHDQTPDAPHELNRLQKEHPNEPNVASRGRVLGGLMPSRSFGDNNYKYNKTFLTKIIDFFHLKKDRSVMYRFIPNHYQTPPYVTAEPEILSHDISEKDQFMVIATDGLWERLNNQQVVNIVGKWIHAYKNGKLSEMDKDPSTYLMRQAFVEPLNIKEHNDAQKLALLLSIPSDHSRRYRDDITIFVIMFKNANISMNTSEYTFDDNEYKWPRDAQHDV
eukprot:NODE_879_length_3345_cov_0.345040.p1 type:complete len:465 gc:universal NODE_879_length_3345_cov_0.345040:2008-614(-)